MPRPAVIDKEVAEPEVVAVRKVFLEPLLADRGVAEPLVDGIDPVGHFPIASAGAHRCWSTYGAAEARRVAECERAC